MDYKNISPILLCGEWDEGYASNGRARNNIGHWNVEAVYVPPYVKGFDFYKQKDIAMADSADYGSMIWDGKSKGTLNNIINLTVQNKKTVVYMPDEDKPYTVDGYDSLKSLILKCDTETQKIYNSLAENQKYDHFKMLSLT